MIRKYLEMDENNLTIFFQISYKYNIQQMRKYSTLIKEYKL